MGGMKPCPNHFFGGRGKRQRRAPGSKARWRGQRDELAGHPGLCIPGLLEVYGELDEENERHRQVTARLRERIGEIKSGEQGQFNRLLTAEGRDLQDAVIKALKYLNWLNVVDVNEYWKHVIRVKEEDIWLLDEDEKSIEQLIRDSPITMVMVKSGEGGASDEDGLNLQRYKGRRMQEFNNTRFKAVLIGNFFCRVEAKLRETPFSETRSPKPPRTERTADNIRALQGDQGREREKTTKEAIREQFSAKVGLITFEY